MQNDQEVLDPNAVDEAVDKEIYQCLNLSNPKSFFLYAGAGSGKTRSLVNAVDRVRPCRTGAPPGLGHRLTLPRGRWA